MTTDEMQDSDGTDRKVEAADEVPQPRKEVGDQWTAWQLAERYNLCMRVNRATNLAPFTWREILVLDGYHRNGIIVSCLDHVEQYSDILGPNTIVKKKRVKAELKRSNDERGKYIEASQAKIDEYLNPSAAADELSDETIETGTETTTDTGSSELVEVQGAQPEVLDAGDGGDEVDDGDVEDPDPLGVGVFLEKLLGRDWSDIDPWLKERADEFKKAREEGRKFPLKEPNDAVSALRSEIADLEVEFAREVLFELAAPSDRLFPDYKAKLRQTLLLEELLRHDPRYIEVIDAGEASAIDNLPFRAGQAARALTYGNRRLNEEDTEDGRDKLLVISFVHEHHSDEPEGTPPTIPDEPEPTAVVVIEPPAPEPVVSITDVEPEPPEASEPPVGEEVDDEPEPNDVDDSELLAELDGLLTSGRERVAEMAELGFTA